MRPRSNAPPQIVILLWHHVCYYKRHWIKLIVTIILPFLFLLPIYFLTDALTNGKLGDLVYQPDCQHRTIAPFSSGPLHYLTTSSCYNWNNYGPSPSCTLQSDDAILDRVLRINAGIHCRSGNDYNGYYPGNDPRVCNPDYYASEQTFITQREADCTLRRGYILFYPNVSAVRNIMENVVQQLEKFDQASNLSSKLTPEFTDAAGPVISALKSGGYSTKNYIPTRDRIVVLESRTEAFQYASNLSKWMDNTTYSYGSLLPNLWGIVGFDDVTTDNGKLPTVTDYRIIRNLNRDSWQLSTFFLQTMVETAIVKEKTGKSVPFQAVFKQLPTKCSYVPSSIMFSALQYAIPAVYVFSFLMVGMNFLDQVLTEKWLKLREYMYIQGVGAFTLKFSWVLFYMIFLIPMTVVFILIFFYFPYTFTHTDFSVLFFLLILYNLAQFAFCYFLAAILKNPKRSGMLYAFLVAFVYILVSAIFLTGLDMTASRVVLARVLCLHCATPMILGLAYILQWEQVWLGAHWENAMYSPFVGNHFGGFGEAIIWLVADIFIYLLLAWYIEHVFPGDYGVKQKPWFIFQPSFWFPKRFKKPLNVNFGVDNADVEPVATDSVPGVAIQNMCKAYTAEKIGLRNLNVNFYENEITAFLGQNGAGKSTTLNALVGLISPSSGDAEVAGFDIRSQMSTIRSKLGFVPQYDILYPTMTVEEHLQFFGWLKGYSKTQIFVQMRKLLDKVDLSAHLKTTCTKLSGGQRRKLSVLTAYLGEPQVVILDEPTSGVDPYSRRAIWDLILETQYRGTTILSTHHMEEADILGKRVAIISEGSLKTFGTPMFLKNKYGLGFKLTIATQSDDRKFDIKHFINELLPASKLIQESGNDLNFSVPLHLSHTNAMTDALKSIELNQTKLGILSFGISEPTMEEVFFAATGMKRLVNDDSTVDALSDLEDYHDNDTVHNSMATLEPDGSQHGNSSEIEYVRLRGPQLYLDQFVAFFMKRVRYAIRSIAGFVFQIVLPLAFVTLLLLIGKNMTEMSGGSEEPVLAWTKYHKNVFFISDNTNKLNALVAAASSHGFGPRCPGGIDSMKCNGPSGSSILGDTTSLTPEGTCTCNDTCQFPSNARELLNTMTPSTDEVYNLKSNNVTDWVIHLNQSDKIVVGGFESFALNKTVFDQVMNVIGGQSPEMRSLLTETTLLDYVVVWSKPELRAAIANVYANMLLKLHPATKDDSIRLTQERLKLSTGKASQNTYDISKILGPIFGSVFLSLAFGFSMFGIANFIQYENSTGLKQLQFMAGGSRAMYWLANLAFDFLQFLVTLSIIAFLLAVVDNSFQDSVRYVFMVMIPYGLQCISLTYCCSLLFRGSGGIVRLQIISLFLCLIIAGTLSSFSSANLICQAQQQNPDPGYREKCLFSWAPGLNLVFDLYPIYYVVDVFVTMATALTLQNTGGIGGSGSPFQNLAELLKNRVIVSLVSAVVYMAIAVLLELFNVQLSFECDCCGGCACCKCCRKQSAEVPQQFVQFNDADVSEEVNRVMLAQPDANAEPLVVKQMVKRYPKAMNPAVAGVTFGVKSAECFGLLGINGAGKTTLFKMLTGSLKPTSGTAQVETSDLFKNRIQTQRMMNYCPQDGALFDLLTPHEHLALFATLHGIPGRQRKSTMVGLASEVGLSEHLKKYASELSGGNQRKLQFALSLLDYRKLIFLDEPTTGLDPGARRNVWSCIQNAINRRNCSVVLTSHSMDECEALCNRLVIMVCGQLRCIGSVQYLKDKFGNQYTFKIKSSVASRDDETDGSNNGLQAFIRSNLPLAQLIEQHSSVLSYKVPARDLKLSGLFDLLNSARLSFDIEDFTVTQTTLEHVFVNMAQTQEIIQSGMVVNFGADGQPVLVPVHNVPPPALPFIVSA